MEEQNSIEQMTVLMVEPGYEPYEKTIPNTLAAKQELVGGLITAIYPYEEMVAIVAMMKASSWGWTSTAAWRAAMVAFSGRFSCAG